MLGNLPRLYCAAYTYVVTSSSDWNQQLNESESQYVDRRSLSASCISAGAQRTCISTLFSVFEFALKS